MCRSFGSAKITAVTASAWSASRGTTPSGRMSSAAPTHAMTTAAPKTGNERCGGRDGEAEQAERGRRDGGRHDCDAAALRSRRAMRRPRVRFRERVAGQQGMQDDDQNNGDQRGQNRNRSAACRPYDWRRRVHRPSVARCPLESKRPLANVSPPCAVNRETALNRHCLKGLPAAWPSGMRLCARAFDIAFRSRARRSIW